MNTSCIVYLDPRSPELLALAADAQQAAEDGRSLRVYVEDGVLKYKVGEGMWTPPIASHRPNGGY